MELMLFYNDFQHPAPLWKFGKDPVLTDRGALFLIILWIGQRAANLP